MGLKKRGYYYSIDALIALIIIFSVLLSVKIIQKPVYDEITVHEDLINVLSNLKMEEINNSYVLELLVEKKAEANKTVLEQISEFHAKGMPEAKMLTDSIFENLNSTKNLGIWFNDELISSTNTSSIENSTDIWVSRQLISGIERGENTRGYSSRAILTRTNQVKYFYFGGYVGDGNISVLVSYNGTIKNADIEIATNSNVKVYVNNVFALDHIKQSSDPLVPEIFNLSSYLNLFHSGNNTITFSGNYIYIAGGFVRVSYEASGIELDNKKYLAGIHGIVNLYDGLNIPENLTSIEARINLNSSYNVFFVLGNKTLFNGTSNGTIIIPNSVFSSFLDYSKIAGKTIPFKIGTENATLISIINGSSDVSLISDVSGSMDDCNVNVQAGVDCDSHHSGIQNEKMPVAKNVSKVFVDIVLNVTGNNVGLVSYSSLLNDKHNLSSNSASLKNQIEGYEPEGSTCISCGIIESINQLTQQEKVIEKEGLWHYSSQYYPEWNYLNFSEFWETQKMPFFNYQFSPYNYNLSKVKIAIIGDYNNNIKNLLISYGFNNITSYTYYNYNPTTLATRFNATIIVKIDADSDFKSLVTSARRKTPLIFLGGSPYYSYGLGVLSQAYENPKYVYQKSGSAVTASVLSNKGLLSDYSQGSQITLINGGSNDYNEFSEFNGETLSKVSSGVMGVNYVEKHYLLPYAVNYYTDVNDWTEDGKKIFIKAINLSSNYHAYFPNGTYYLRKTFDLDSIPINASASFFIDDKAEIYLNNILLLNSTTTNGSYWNYNISINPEILVNGSNLISVKLINEDNYSGGFDMELSVLKNPKTKAMVVMSDGLANVCALSRTCSSPTTQAVNLACEAYSKYGIKIYAIAFGSDADSTTLRNIACCDDCNNFYQGNNATDFFRIYEDIAQKVVNATYYSQTLIPSGGFLSNRLFPDSYIKTESNFTQPYGLAFTSDSGIFGSQNEGNFVIPENYQVLSALGVSYSGSAWTENAEIFNNNSWNKFYKLNEYGNDYVKLGDPYTISIPLNNLSKGNNKVRISISYSSSNVTNGSRYNKVIYTLLNPQIPYSPILASSSGCNWNIEFFDNYNISLKVPANYTGISNCFYTSSSKQYKENDATDYSVFQLLSSLDVNSDGRVDAKFPSDSFEIDSNEISGIPFTYVSEVQVRTWK